MNLRPTPIQLLYQALSPVKAPPSLITLLKRKQQTINLPIPFQAYANNISETRTFYKGRRGFVALKYLFMFKKKPFWSQQNESLCFIFARTHTVINVLIKIIQKRKNSNLKKNLKKKTIASTNLESGNRDRIKFVISESKSWLELLSRKTYALIFILLLFLYYKNKNFARWHYRHAYTKDYTAKLFILMLMLFSKI